MTVCQCSKKLIIWIVALALLAGCSSSVPPEQPKEIVKSSLNVSDADQRRLLEEAQSAYEKELYTQSRESFEKLRNSYPLGPYAELADIKIADSYFSQGDFSNAATRFDTFVKEHPASGSIQYAMIMAGRSFQLSNKGVGRDPGPLGRAVQYFQMVISNYPNGPYGPAASAYLQEARLQLAQYDLAVLEYYRRNGPEAAFKPRLLNFRRSWSDLIAKQLIENPAD